MIAKVEVVKLNEDGVKLVSAIEAAQALPIRDKMAVLQLFEALVRYLDGRMTFEHPTKGELTIMYRKNGDGGSYFWRDKPNGRKDKQKGETMTSKANDLAKKAGVSFMTAYKYLKEGEFKKSARKETRLKILAIVEGKDK